MVDSKDKQVALAVGVGAAVGVLGFAWGVAWQKTRPPRQNKRSKLLFTPGPLSVSLQTKQAMLVDMGSRDAAFIDTVAKVRRRLLALSGLSGPAWTVVPVQGSGTFGLEAVLSSLVPKEGKALVLANGAYGLRMAQIATRHGVNHTVVADRNNEVASAAHVAQLVAADPQLTDVFCVHSETTSGIVNPVEELGKAMHDARHAAGLPPVRFHVDGMSSWPVLPLNLEAAHVTSLTSSANKCLEGVPGIALVLVRTADLQQSKGRARTVVLDLLAQWQGLETDGQFRFTPPTHAIMALSQALDELAAEGGPAARRARYQTNHKVVCEGLSRLGFEQYVAPSLQGPIITSFLYPAHPNFSFPRFYQELSDRGYVIYPGKVTEHECFRIGHIGCLTPQDSQALVNAIRDVCVVMGVQLR